MAIPRPLLVASLMALVACAGTTGSPLPEDEYLLDPFPMDTGEPAASEPLSAAAVQVAPEPPSRAAPTPVAVHREPPPPLPPPPPTVVSAPPSPPPPPPSPPVGTYRVRRGDTLYRIARTRLGSGTRWKEIAALNGLREPFLIRVGQELRLP